jgi:hypothetical protein
LSNGGFHLLFETCELGVPFNVRQNGVSWDVWQVFGQMDLAMALPLPQELRMRVGVPSAGAPAISAEKVLELGDRGIELDGRFRTGTDGRGDEGIEPLFSRGNLVGDTMDVQIGFLQFGGTCDAEAGDVVF